MSCLNFNMLPSRFSAVFLIAVLFVFAPVMSTVGGFALAQGQIIPSIMVVDLQKVMEKSKAAASLQAQLDVVNDKNQAEVTPQAEGVKVARQKLQEARATLSAGEFATERAELDRLIKAYQTEVSTRKTELQGRMNRSMREIQKKLQAVVIELAGERGANIVLAKGAVIIMAGEFDATNEALIRLDEQMPTVTLAQ